MGNRDTSSYYVSNGTIKKVAVLICVDKAKYKYSEKLQVNAGGLTQGLIQHAPVGGCAARARPSLNFVGWHYTLPNFFLAVFSEYDRFFPNFC